MNLTLKDFEGPLDLLLHLVKTAKMNIYEIDTKKVIEEYIAFINSVDKKDLDVSSEYLVMAAELIHLKSKLLVNDDETNEDDEYEINSEEDLKKKLIEYEKYKNVCEVFRDYEINRKDFFTKSPEILSEYDEEKKYENNFCIDDLVNAFLELKKREEYQKPLFTKITKKELSVEEKTSYIKSILNTRKKVNFLDLFVLVTKEEIIVTFLAILNMSKDGMITITQKDNFGNIFIEGSL